MLPVFGDVQNNVAVVIVAGNIEYAVHRHGQQPLYSARVLFRSGLVRAPEILECAGRAVGELDLLKDDVIAVPYKRVRLLRFPFVYPDRRRRRRRNAGIEPLDGLADSPVAVVVGVQHADRAVRLRRRSHRDKAVLGIVSVGERAVARHVAVGVVHGIRAG